MREGLAYFIAEPPEYEAHGDHIVAKRGGMEFFMPIWVAQEIVTRLNEALDQWHSCQNNVVSLPRH